ncbi:hypothetical protein KIS4809_2739 [Bacillus sp. ZZV12-4809]|nr:hypothetical protein KIS4809_2739 [Bacillus sp. ZZV12-4809]
MFHLNAARLFPIQNVQVFSGAGGETVDSVRLRGFFCPFGR